MRRFIFFLVLVLTASPALHAEDFLARKQVKLGSEVAGFELPDTNGNLVKLSDYKGQITVIHFWSAYCPFVVRYDARIKEIAADYQDKNVAVIGIDSNGNEPIAEIQAEVNKRNIFYPILIDQFHQVADDFGAITTPHVYILDEQGILVYEGAVDDQGYGANNPVTKRYVRDALDALIAGHRDFEATTRTVGCTVKRVDYV